MIDMSSLLLCSARTHATNILAFLKVVNGESGASARGSVASSLACFLNA